MKIGIVLNNVYDLGGVTRVVFLLCKIFSKILHHEVTLFSCFTRSGEGTPFFECSNRIKIVHLSEDLAPDSYLVRNSFSQKTFLKRRILKEMKLYLKEYPQDILISTCCWSNCFLPFFSNGAKTVLCDHGAFNFIPWIYRCISRICYPYGDAVVSLTHRNLKHYTFMPDNKKYVIPNPNSFETEECSTCENKTIVTLTRLSHEKGVDIQLHIAAKIKNLLPDWTMDIYGNGEDEGPLKALANKLDLGNFVRFFPATKDVKEKLLNSSIYLLSSRHEGLPMVLIEAQVCGLPCISFDCDYGPSGILTDGVDGYLIPQGDLDTFAEKIVKLANDEELRKKFGVAAKESSQRFSVEKIAKYWEDLFERIK